MKKFGLQLGKALLQGLKYTIGLICPILQKFLKSKIVEIEVKLADKVL